MVAAAAAAADRVHGWRCSTMLTMFKSAHSSVSARRFLYGGLFAIVESSALHTAANGQRQLSGGRVA